MIAYKEDALPREAWEMQPFQVLSPAGELLANVDEKIDEALMIKMYKKMALVRVFDRKCILLQRQGKLGTYAPFEGQEAAQVGSAMAMAKSDWMFPTYRDHAASITHGQRLVNVFLYWMGHLDGTLCPEGMKLMPPSVPIATQMLHAVGTAWASRIRGEKECSIVYFGDGATSEGDFHESLNFAGVFKTPTVFFCQNNGFAISVPFKKQSASRTIAQRAAAYDITGIRVDGNDIFAVWIAVKEAVERGTRGEGPTLIEAVTYRYGAHTTADDPRKYRDQERLEREWREQRDPVVRLRLLLEKRNLWDAKKEEEFLSSATAQVEEAFRQAMAYPKVKPEDMFEHIYADKPWYLYEQQKDLVNRLSKGVGHE